MKTILSLWDVQKQAVSFVRPVGCSLLTPGQGIGCGSGVELRLGGEARSASGRPFTVKEGATEHCRARSDVTKTGRSGQRSSSLM